MSEVLIDDSSLNAIAHSIRRKNGLLRTYKPREMAPAIRAFNDFVPDAHSFTINVQQSPHQTIRLRKYLDADYKEYTNTFTISEPFYKADIIVEADAGYEAGKPNYVSPITIDRDMVINASPATEAPQPKVTTLYLNGTTTGAWWGQFHYELYPDPECRAGTAVDRTQIRGILQVIDISDGYPNNGMGLLGQASNQDNHYASIYQVDEIIQNIDVSKKVTLECGVSECHSLKRIDLSNWNPVSVTTLYHLFWGDELLQYTGDISYWNMPELLHADNVFQGCTSIQSVNLHNWNVPNLITCNNMFVDCTRLKCVDISGLTTNVDMTDCSNMFRNCSSLKYIIMDRNEVMFQNTIFGNPNNTVKYLVPSDYVNLYKEHANWQSRASQIDSIDNYTITRYGGQVFVTPNN